MLQLVAMLIWGYIAKRAVQLIQSYGVGALGRYYLGVNQVNKVYILRAHTCFFEGNVGFEGKNVKRRNLQMVWA